MCALEHCEAPAFILTHMTAYIQQSKATRTGGARRIAAMVLAGFVGVLLIIQFVPYGRDHTDPPVIAEPAWDSPQTRAPFFRACADCHSNETTWPWYSTIALASWLITRDVMEGRAKFNVSNWGRPDNEGDMPRKPFRTAKRRPGSPCRSTPKPVRHPPSGSS
jgi:mono/diheme cytochrome c family protein